MEGSAGSPSAASSGLLPAHPDHNELPTADGTSKTQEDTRQRLESASLTEPLVNQSPEETKQGQTETQGSAEDSDQLCLTQTDSVITAMVLKPLPTKPDQPQQDHSPTDPENLNGSPATKDPLSIPKQDSPSPSMPEPDSPKPLKTPKKHDSLNPTITKPDSPEPFFSEPDSPKPTTSKPDSPKPTTSKPDSPKPSTSQPDSPKPSMSQPDSPKPSTSQPDSPKPSTSQPDSPKPSTSQPDSPKPSTSQPDSPKPSTSQPDSPKPSTSKPDSPKLTTTKPELPNSSKTKPDSTKPSTPKPKSPKPSTSKPDSSKPSTTKSDPPKPCKTKLDSSHKPETPKPSKTNPDSLNQTLPKPDSHKPPKTKQGSANPSKRKPESKKPSKTEPDSSKPSEPRPDSQKTSKTKPPSPLPNTEQTPPPPSPLPNTEQTPPPPSPLPNTEQTPPPTPSPLLNTKQTPSPPPSPLPNTEQTPPPPPSPLLNTEQTPPPPPSPLPNTEQTPSPPPSPLLNTEQTPPPTPSPLLNTEQTPPPPKQKNKKTPPQHLKAETPSSPPPLPNTEQTPSSPPPLPNTEQTPSSPPPLPNTEQTPSSPPPLPNTEQTPSSPPPLPNTEQTPPPLLNTEQTPPSPFPLNTEQTPSSPPPLPNTKQTPPPLPNTEKTPSSRPPSSNTEQTQAPSPYHDTVETPPPVLNTEQTPPLLYTEQTSPSTPPLSTEKTPSLHLETEPAPPPLLPSSTVDQTNILTPPPPASPLIPQSSSDQVQPAPPAPSSGEPKLCGYLQKQAGPLRAWKERWFTYEEKKNQLFYYRTPQDVTPLGRVELCSATFSFPLNAERGTFHIRTPERTFILRAVTQDLMLYWLQQLQLRRWQHRQTTAGPDLTNNNNFTDDFLPVMKSPLGLVGEGAANTPSQRMALVNMSLKHPLITIQNSVHSRKRSSQEWTQSLFYVETPSETQLDSGETSSTAPCPPSDPPASSSSTEPPPPVFPLAEPAGQLTPVVHRKSPVLDSSPRRTKSRSLMILRRDTMSSEQASRFLQENQRLEEELKAQKDLVLVLHRALEASQLEKRTCAEFLAATDEQERLELLRHRERQAADLRARLQEAREEAETARRSQAQSAAQVRELQEMVRLLEEKNSTRQEVIVKLSDQLTTCMGAPPRSSGCDENSQTPRRLQQQIQNLQDDMEAYQTQNRFLNSEIQQLTKLWRTSSEMEKSLMVKCAHLEAGNCQVESRYLGVLRQLQEVKALDPVQRAAVQKMVNESLKGELKSPKPNLAREWDEYGFKIIPDYEVEDMKLLAKIQALEIRSHNLLHQERGERPLLARWAQYLAGRSDDDLMPSPELKGLLRAGIPQEYRQQVWRWLVRARTRTIREHHPQRYKQLCEQSRASSHPAFRQIQLDLHRTLTTNQHFSSPSSPALQQLRRILLAFSWQNPTIGYCQGLNRLAALALLVLQSEEDAFWCLVAVVEAIMPQDYYTKNLVASQADQRVLKDLLSEKLPRLAAHFEDHSIDVSLVSFNWFLVVFVESLPSDILLPLWDAFLYEGTKVIFRYALALFKYKEDDIMKIKDSVEIYQYLRFFTKTISDSRKLISIAFSDMNPFPGRMLRNRRAFHLERLQAELRELEEQQRLFVTESAEHKDKELDTGVSEDDEDLT
ncbi:TBC1 domain family member 2B [Halichoeres trimaculatus]|uniref:TBC1 domain family member 2B n=1 Tax=Halichoeres trimaculatus TaxID=147232 RepID=UPI003D9F8FF2